MYREQNPALAAIQGLQTTAYIHTDLLSWVYGFTKYIRLRKSTDHVLNITVSLLGDDSVTFRGAFRCLSG